jgi:L-histidine N-alpha-methyltransferase
MPLAKAFPVLPEAAHTPLGSDVYRGLTAIPKRLSPWLFYDQRGSQLFEQITQLPEYYLTRTERGIFADHADDIIAAASGGKRLTLLELGAGTASKTGLLLQAAVRKQKAVTYHAIDVSESALSEAQSTIQSSMPEVKVETRVGDYTEGLGEIESAGRRLVLYIGSSIGNFEPTDAAQLLTGLRRQLSKGDKLLLGVDHVKDRTTLRLAYDDAAGVTAAFNLNLLTRINRELGGNFNLRRFRHRVLWNHERSRMEMHLESLLAQQVSIPALELEIRLQRGETIHTENSYKFTADSVTELMERGGFAVEKQWTDRKAWFGVYLAAAQ